MTCPSNGRMAHAMLSMNQTKLCFFALMPTRSKAAICKFPQGFDSLTVFPSFDGTVYHFAGSAHYSHYRTHGLANYKGRALTTGCAERNSCAKKTELLDMNTLKWSDGPDYPFDS